MLEIKTSEAILNDTMNNMRSKSDKKWVSADSLLKELEKNLTEQYGVDVDEILKEIRKND